MQNTRQFFLFTAWFIALVATLSTLYASEIAHLPVCTLCWYQRLAIYPLVIILGIGAYQDDLRAISYALLFPVFGFLLAIYQYLEQMIPGFAPIDLCSQGVPCSTIHIKLLGFITLPLLSALSCAMIFGCLMMAKKTCGSKKD